MFFDNHNDFDFRDLAITIFIISLIILLLIAVSFISSYISERINSKNKEIEILKKVETPEIETGIPQNEYPSLGIREISAYTLSEDETDNDFCITASGVNACESELPIIATNSLPFWTYVEIKGKEYVVLDRMNSRYQNGEMDILMRIKKEAIEFGRQRLEVKIIK